MCMLFHANLSKCNATSEKKPASNMLQINSIDVAFWGRFDCLNGYQNIFTTLQIQGYD